MFMLNGRIFQDKNKSSFTLKEKTAIYYVVATPQWFELICGFRFIETDALFSDGHNALNIKY